MGRPIVQAPRDPDTRRDLRRATLFAVLADAAVVLTWTAPVPVLDAAVALTAAIATWLRHADGSERAMVTTVLAALAALRYVAVWARASSERRPVRLAGGLGTVSVDELAARLRATLLRRPDVRDAQVRVENLHRRGVRVAARIEVTPDARLTETARACAARIERAVAARAGVKLAGAPDIMLRYDELVLRPRRGSSRESDAA